MYKCKCLNCGYEFELESASRDDLGWHTTCLKCNGSFDIDVKKYLIPNHMIVRCNESDQDGIIVGNDSNCSSEFENINYFITPLNTNFANCIDDYIILKRSQFKIFVMNRNYYIQKYENRMDEIYKELKYDYDIPDNEIDEKCTIEFDETANASEIVGYYLINYEWNPLKGWLENLQYSLNITEQDKMVTEILTELSKNNYQ